MSRERNMEKKAPPHRRWRVGLSLVPTPFLLFVSSSLDLYLRNQSLLSHRTKVLVPFLEAFALVWILGWILHRGSGRAAFRYLLWGYYLIGPFVLTLHFLSAIGVRFPSLGYLLLSPLLQTRVGLILWPGSWIAASFLLGRRSRPGIAEGALAAFAGLLLAGETVHFLGEARWLDPRASSAGLELDATERAGTWPNVYHVVLDGFQSDYLDLTLSPELEKRLGGFLYFRENRAVYHATSLSLASTFRSRRYRYQESPTSFLEATVSSESSLLHRLKQAGYVMVAYVPELRGLDFRNFDRLIHHQDNAGGSVPVDGAAFRRLWYFANLPETARRWWMGSPFLSERERRQWRLIEKGQLLPDSAPVVSYWSFESFLQAEPFLPGRGRYTFVHLLIPHDPYVLRADCSYDLADDETDPLAQSGCALRLISNLTELLTRLGRLEDSLIVVHGDHGGPYRVREGALVPARARSLRSLLLVKPVGRTAAEDLVISDLPSSLLDIAPTILAAIGLPPDGGFEGSSLMDVSPGKSLPVE